jgi:glycosyltransferase involved in cell wall biosynthesis
MEDQTGHPGAMITANDSSGLVSGLEEMISNPAAREEFGRRGVAVTDHFGWEHMVSQFESLLREAASDRSTS